MSDILLFLAILLGQCLLAFIIYRVVIAIILYRFVVNNSKGGDSVDS